MKLIYNHTATYHVTKPVFLLCVFRNECLLLDFFMSYYKNLGVTHFIMVDNLSEDGGSKLIESQADINVQLYHAEGSYRKAEFGTLWINELLNRHCRDQYCLVVDADELFVFDTRVFSTLSELIVAMETIGANAVPSYVVDMYPYGIDGKEYCSGADFRSHSYYFDDLNGLYYRERGAIQGGFKHKVGGLRARVLGTTVCIHKFQFFRYDFYPVGVAPGYHFFQDRGKILIDSSAIKLFNKPAVTLHFKFIKPNFRDFIARRIANNEDWNDSAEYRAYMRILEQNDALQLFDENYSKKLESIVDLEKFFAG